MEIKKVGVREYSNLNGYISKILPITKNLKHLCSVDYNDKRYYITNFYDTYVVVLEEDGALRRYYFEIGSRCFNFFDDEENFYDISSSNPQEVYRTNNKSKDRMDVVYYDSTLGFQQAKASTKSTLSLIYQVPTKISLEDALLYIKSQNPYKITLSVMRDTLLRLRKNNYYFGVTPVNVEEYYQLLMKVGNYFFGQKKELVTAKTIFDEIKEQGFVDDIPEDVVALLKGENKTYNELKLIANHYEKYLMGQK